MTEPNEAKVQVLLDIINSSAHQAIAEYKKTGHGVPAIDADTLHPLDFATDAVALRKAIRLLEGACEQLNTILAPPQHTAYNFVNNYNWACVDVALQSRIADVLDKHPQGLSVDALANAVDHGKTKIARVLRVLALRGCFKEGNIQNTLIDTSLWSLGCYTVKRDVFANTRLSLVLKSTNNVAAYMGQFPKYAAALYGTMMDKEFAKSGEVEKPPRASNVRKEGKEDSFWEMGGERLDIFHRGMVGYSEIQCSSAVLHYYPWDNVSSVVDVGSGTGAMSIPLAKMFPNLRITNQDLPGALEMARNIWEKNAPEALLGGHIEFVPLNFWEESPVVGKDVYYLRNIIHDWPDNESMMILHNIRKVMGPNSRVLIHECVLLRKFEEPDVGANEFSKDHEAPENTLLNFGSHTTHQLDLLMWLSFNGKERTKNEFKIIAASAGLALTQIYDLVGTMLLEFRIAQD